MSITISSPTSSERTSNKKGASSCKSRASRSCRRSPWISRKGSTRESLRAPRRSSRTRAAGWILANDRARRPPRRRGIIGNEARLFIRAIRTAIHRRPRIFTMTSRVPLQTDINYGCTRYAANYRSVRPSRICFARSQTKCANCCNIVVTRCPAAHIVVDLANLPSISTSQPPLVVSRAQTARARPFSPRQRTSR